MDSFEKLVKYCADNDSTRIIQNASMEHAKILLRQLLLTASEKGETVRIVSGRLRRDFYNDLLAEAQKTLDRVKVSIVVLSGDQLDGNRFFELVRGHHNGEVVVLEQEPERWTHFIVVGDKRYRVEEDDGKQTAHASFNNEIIPQLLIDRFEYLLEKGAAA